MANRSMGTVISKNLIPFTATFKFSIGSPAKPEKTLIRPRSRRKIPSMTKEARKTPINPSRFSHTCGFLKIIRLACPIFRARHD
jgi:hypothetical protein